VGDGAVWAVGDRIVSRVDPRSGRVVARIVPSDQSIWIGGNVAAGEGGIWLGYGSLDAGIGFVRIDPATNELATTIQAPRGFGIAAGEGGVWISNNVDNSVWGIDPATNRVMRKIQVGDGPQSVAAGAGSVWVANSLAGTVSRIDPKTGSVVATIEVGGRPDDIAVGEGGVWVTTYPA
jgi:virginiamycin B lyase